MKTQGAIRWSDGELDTIRNNYNPKNRDETLETCYLLLQGRRTKGSILSKVYEMGLFYEKKTKKRWDEKQIEFLHTHAENIPIKQLTAKLNRFSEKRKLPLRSFAAVKIKLYELGYTHQGTGLGCEYFNASDIADIFGCSLDHSTKLIKNFKEMFRPKKNGTEYVIKHNNFVKFIREYPGEVAKLNPNIVMLIDVLCGKKQ